MIINLFGTGRGHLCFTNTCRVLFLRNYDRILNVQLNKANECRLKGITKNWNDIQDQCVFSAPEPKAQVHYCDHALSVVRLSSVRRLSSVVVNFSHFRLLLWNHWTEFDETLQEGRSQCPLPSLCFSGRSEKQDGRPGLWLAKTFSTSPLKPLNGIQRNLTGSKISMSSTKFVFFRTIGKTRWPPWPLIGWDIFDFSSETAERNSMKLDRKQDLNVLYQVCVFQADRKNKMAALASDWLRHFRLLLWNHWTEFNETWQEARSQRPLPSLCFSGWSEKQDGRPGQSAKKVAHCTQVHDMWPFGPLVITSISWFRTRTRDLALRWEPCQVVEWASQECVRVTWSCVCPSPLDTPQSGDSSGLQTARKFPS